MSTQPILVGVPTPNYVRSVTVHNQSTVDVEVQVHFQSGETVNYTVGKDPVEIEKSIDHGGYSTVDSVIDFRVNYGAGEGNSVSCQDAAGIERRHYVIHENKTVERKHQ